MRIKNLRLADAIGISYEFAPRFENDFAALRIICNNGGTPANPTANLCQGETELIAETNAGKIVLPIKANVLTTATPTPEIPVCETDDDYFRGCREEWSSIVYLLLPDPFTDQPSVSGLSAAGTRSSMKVMTSVSSFAASTHSITSGWLTTAR